MKFDYWHLHRYVQLQGSSDDDVLPFEAGSMVMSNVLSMREPVWRTAVTTARQPGVDSVFGSWGRDRPIVPAVAAQWLAPLRAAIWSYTTRAEIEARESRR